MTRWRAQDGRYAYAARTRTRSCRFDHIAASAAAIFLKLLKAVPDLLTRLARHKHEAVGHTLRGRRMRPRNARGPPGTRSGSRPTHALRHESSTNSQILEKLLPASARLSAPALGAQREHRRGRHAQAAACRATSTGTSRLVFVFEYAHRLAASAAEVLERLLPSCGGSRLARTKNLPLPITLPRHSTPNPCALLGRPSSPKMPAKNHPLLPSVPVHVLVGFYLNFYH